MHPADPHTDDLLTTAQIAEEYGIPPATVRKWASRGRIIPYPGRHRAQRTMYARQHIEQLAETYRATPQRAPRTTSRTTPRTGAPPRPPA